MKNVMIVDDNCLTAEGIEKNIDWSALYSGSVVKTKI